MKQVDLPPLKRLRRLPPLNLFRVFDAAARHGGFTLAADELCVTQSAVSQQIRQLEELLDVRLFRRLPRRVELTREGLALAGVVQDVLAMLGRACDRLADPNTPVVICVNATPSLASRWLVPRLKRFMELHPTIKVTLIGSNDTVDFDRQDIDVAIRWGRGEWLGVRAEPLGAEPVFPVCSPALLRRVGGINSPRDFLRHTLLQVVHGITWASWFDSINMPGMAFADTLYFSESDHMLEAAAQGQGICLTDYFLAEKDLLSERVVRAFDRDILFDECYYVLSSPVYGEKPAVVTFRQWIRDEAATAIASIAYQHGRPAGSAPAGAA